MKIFCGIVLCLVLTGLFACGGSTRKLSQKEIRETVEAGGIDRDRVLDRADRFISLGLAWYDECGYEKSAALFMKAADLYRTLPDNGAERRALLAAAKARLKGGDRDAFLKIMSRYRGLVGEDEVPGEEGMFFLNLSASMRGETLPCPVKHAWHKVFKQN